MLLLSANFAYGQPAANVAETSLCQLYESPTQYSGKFVRVRARVFGRDLRDLRIEDAAACVAPTTYMSVLGALPQFVSPAPPFSLEDNGSFAEFQRALHRPVALVATLEGRFDPVFVWRDEKRVRIGEGNGFGKRQRYDGRLVLYRIFDVKTISLWRK